MHINVLLKDTGIVPVLHVLYISLHYDTALSVFLLFFLSLIWRVVSGFHFYRKYSVSFGFCNEPPQLRNGIWKTTSSGYMYGTSITAICNDDQVLVGGDNALKCGRGANSSSADFDWHGNTPSCQERILGNKNQGICLWSFFDMIVIVIRFWWCTMNIRK